MSLINQALAADVKISAFQSAAPKIANNWKITDIFTKGGFDLINFIFIIIGLVFFINLILTGWEFMNSSGDPKKVAAASTRLVNGLIGLIMAFFAFLIVRLVTNVLGLGNLV